MLANLLQTVYNLVDTLVVGHFVGTDGLSAVSNCGELIQFYTFLAIGFSGAGQTLIGQFVGAKNRERVNETIGTLFTTLMVMALAVTAFCFATARWQLTLVKLPEEAMAGGMQYLLVCAAGMVFIFGYNMISAVLRGMGDSKRPLLFVAVASMVNLVLDLLFVPVLGLGAMGAALATVLGQGVSFGASLVYLYRRRAQFGFDFRRSSFRPKRELLGALFRLGIPMSTQGALISLSMLYVCSLVNAFGVAASAANGIQIKLSSIVRIVSNSLGTAGSAMTAQCMGAKKPDRVRSVFWWDFAITLAYSILCGLAILIFPRQIFGFFNTDPAVLDYAAVYAIYGLFDALGFAMRSPCNSLINGTGAALLGMTAGILDGVVARIGFSILFGNLLGMGVAGYWLGNTLAGYVSFVICAPYYFSGAWKRKKLIVDQ
jgi:putative MATE family efflux protein